MPYVKLRPNTTLYMTLCAPPIHHTVTTADGKKEYSSGKSKREKRKEESNERPRAEIILQTDLSASNQASL